MLLHATDDRPPPARCATCGADSMGCGVKLGLSGRRCCADCGHDDDRRGDDHVDHHDLDHVDHHGLHIAITTIFTVAITTVFTLKEVWP